MRQYVASEVDIVRRVRDRDVTVEFDVLQTESISASAAAIQSPERKFGDVDCKTKSERAAAICRHCDAGRRVQSHGAAGCIIGVPEAWCNRVCAGRVAVIVYFDLFAKGSGTC